MKDIRLSKHVCIENITYGQGDEQFCYSYVIDNRWPTARIDVERKLHSQEAERARRASG